MGDAAVPSSPFEALYNEFYDSLCRFDAMMQQSPFGSSLWWRPMLPPFRPQETHEAQHQQRQGQCPSLQQSYGRGEMTPWGGSLVQWPHVGHGGWFHNNGCIPRIDLRDGGDKLVLHADMPGLDKNDVKVEAHDGRLSIQAQTSKNQEHSDGNWFMRERCSTNFYRSFALPPGTQQEGIKASYNNGVLEVNIPKPTSPTTPTSRTINIE